MKINKRKIQNASLSTVFIILFVVLVMLFNVLVGYLTNRFSLKLDLTAEGAYSVSDQTKTLLKGLKEDVTIYIMQSEADIQKDQTDTKPRVVESLRRYSSESGNKLKLEFIDPNQNPKFYDDYPLARASKEGEASAFLIVRSDKRYYPVNYTSLVSTDENQSSLYYSTESEVASAVMHVTSDEVSKVATVTGHNEQDVTGLNSIFDGNKFERTSLNLRTDKIPEDVNNLVIGGPNVDFTEQEVAKLDEFMAVPGNNLYVFWGSQLTKKLPILERFLSDWGIAFDERIILDQTNAWQTPVLVLGKLSENDLTQKVQTTQQMYFSPQSHPIQILWDTKSYTRVLPVAVSENTAYARAMTAQANITDARTSDEPKGPFNLAVMSEKNVQQSDGSMKSNRLYAFGSEAAANENITGISASLNNTLFNTMIGYSNSGTQTMTVAPKVVQENDLNFYESQIRTLTIVLLVVLPLLILAAGLIIFIRRRHK